MRDRCHARYVSLPMSRWPSTCTFLFYCSGDHRDLHSFPTRRSSDLGDEVGPGGECLAVRRSGHDARGRQLEVAVAPADLDALPQQRGDQSALTIGREIGRAHVCTPVTP